MKSHLDEIEKSFDEKFPHKIAEVIDDFGSPVKTNIKSFLRTSLISLLEKYGEMIIPPVVIKDVPWKETQMSIRRRQRTKLKEIITSLK